MSAQSAELHEAVRQRYAAVAVAVTEGAHACCGPQAIEVDDTAGSALYPVSERDQLPAEAVAASLGCGNPTAIADLHHGEHVLDLGCGGGLDVLLSARRVGPAGKVYGLDMTEEMLTLARANATKAGVTNAEFLTGSIEAIPLPAGSIDVVISNCVINLSTDKVAVFAETFRVLAAGGRLAVADIVTNDQLSPRQRAERGDYVGCLAGALSVSEYRQGLEAVGFTNIEIIPTHAVADGMHAAVVRATKPATATTQTRPVATTAATDACCATSCCCTPAEQIIEPSAGLGVVERGEQDGG